MSKKYVGIYLAYIVIFVGLCLTGIVSTKQLFSSPGASSYLDLITISSIIGGFMFTSLSILVSVSASSVIQRLERSKHMDSIFANIIVGLVLSIVVIVLSLLFIFIELPEKAQLNSVIITFRAFLNKVLIMGVGCSILSFTLSVFDLKFLIKAVRKNKRTDMSEDDVKQVLNDIPK